MDKIFLNKHNSKIGFGGLLNYPQFQKKISYLVEFRTLCQTFFCKAQVAGWQISTPSTLLTTFLNREGIWTKHMDTQVKTIFGRKGIP